MFGNNRFPLYLPITILLCSCINMVVAEHISESKNKEYFDDNQLLTSGYEDMGIQARNMLHSGDTSAYFKLLNYSFGASLVSCAAVQVNAVFAAPCAAFLLSSLVATVMGLWDSLGRRDGSCSITFSSGLTFEPADCSTSSTTGGKELKNEWKRLEGQMVHYGKGFLNGIHMYDFNYEYVEMDNAVNTASLMGDVDSPKAGSGLHHIVISPVRDGIHRREDHTGNDDATTAVSGDTEAHYYWRDWDYAQERATADHADQVNDLAYKAVYDSDVDASKEGYYQFQLYNGEATDDCGLLTMQPTGYLDNSVDRELSNLCGPVA